MVARERVLPKLADHDKCTACMACLSSCRQGAIKKITGEDGHYYVAVDEERCVRCGSCERTCPVTNAVGQGSNDLRQTLPLRGWSNDVACRERGTSGGIFGAVAHSFIKNGGVVIGACLRDNECKHIVIDDVDDISLLQGSKYMYSDMTDVYKSISDYLSDGTKVLFSGVPCQVAGVLAFFRNNKFRHLLYTIDLVCGGMPSTLLRTAFLRKYPQSIIQSFRTKEKYELICKEKGVNKSYGSKNLLISGFLSGLTNRYSCYDCQYACAHHASDLTLGDYWQRNKENGSGVSLVLVHSERGKRLLDSCNVQTEVVEWISFLPYNPKIVVGRIPWRNRWERRLLHKIMSGKCFYLKNLVYASVYKKYDVIGIAYLAYKKFRSLIEHKRRLRVVKRIISELI